MTLAIGFYTRLNEWADKPNMPAPADVLGVSLFCPNRGGLARVPVEPRQLAIEHLAPSLEPGVA